MPSKEKPLDEYRYAEYLSLGFTEHQAKKLIELKHLSVAVVRGTLKKGCGVNTAYRIYRP